MSQDIHYVGIEGRAVRKQGPVYSVHVRGQPELGEVSVDTSDPADVYAPISELPSELPGDGRFLLSTGFMDRNGITYPPPYPYIKHPPSFGRAEPDPEELQAALVSAFAQEAPAAATPADRLRAWLAAEPAVTLLRRTLEPASWDDADALCAALEARL